MRINVVVNNEMYVFLWKVHYIFPILRKFRSFEIFSYCPTYNYMVTCPVPDVLMHTNRRTDMREIGFYSQHGNAHKNSCIGRGNFTRRESFSVWTIGVLNLRYNLLSVTRIFKNICSCHCYVTFSLTVSSSFRADSSTTSVIIFLSRT